MNPILLNTSTNLNNTQPIKEDCKTYGVPKLKVLQKDTVSFSGGVKRRSRINNEIPVPEKSRPTGIENLPRIVTRAVSSSRQEISSNIKPIVEFVSGKYPYEFRPVKDEETVADKVIEDIIPESQKSGTDSPKKGIDPKKIDHDILLGRVTDITAARIITDGSEEATNVVLKRLISQIEAGHLRLAEVRNYFGQRNNNGGSIPPPPLTLRSIMRPEPRNILPQIPPYLPTDSPLLLKLLGAAGNSGVKVTQSSGKESGGYTSLNILFRTPHSKKPFELQIYGPQVSKINKATRLEHRAAKFAKLEKKNLAKAIEAFGKFMKQFDAEGQKLIMPIMEVYNDMFSKGNDALKKAYSKHIYECYLAARLAEVDKLPGFELPKAPSNLPECLHIQNLIKIAEKLKIK